jgi:hypothetical protein
MAMRFAVVLFAIVVLIAVAPLAYDASVVNAGDDVTVTNESFTPSAGNVTTLDESTRDDAIYDENVTVYNESGLEMTEGTDYTWFEANGTLKTLVGGRLEGDSTATITYGFFVRDVEAERLSGLVSQIPRAIAFALPLGIVLLFLRVLT